MSKSSDPHAYTVATAEVLAIVGACAGEGVWCSTHSHHWPSYRGACHVAAEQMALVAKALAAVAPVIAARAKAEALREAADLFPIRMHLDAQTWLRARADIVEADEVSPA